MTKVGLEAGSLQRIALIQTAHTISQVVIPPPAVFWRLQGALGLRDWFL